MSMMMVLAIAVLFFASFALGFNFALYLVQRDQDMAEERE